MQQRTMVLMLVFAEYSIVHQKARHTSTLDQQELTTTADLTRSKELQSSATLNYSSTRSKL